MNQSKGNLTYFEANSSQSEPNLPFLKEHYDVSIPLRYGTNPHQKAFLYTPKSNTKCLIGKMKILKVGKTAMSQSNIEDISDAVRILKYLDKPAVAIIKHLNPCGVAMANKETQPMFQVYKDAHQVDPRAAFGGVVVFNRRLDVTTAMDMMGSFIEVVAAPAFDVEALRVLKDSERFKRNKHLRIVELGDSFNVLSKYLNTDSDIEDTWEMKVLDDGSLLVSQAYRTRIRTQKDFLTAKATLPNGDEIVSNRYPTEEEYRDMLFGWYVNIGLRSNGIVIAKETTTVALGTGEQDRIGAVEQAIDKAQSKYQGRLDLKGAVLVSDGFFPFADSINLIADAGITAVLQPGGSKQDPAVIQACNQHGVSMVFSGERCFSHH